MNIILILSMIALCSVLSEALVCDFCKIYRTSIGCSVGMGTCEAEPGEKCKIVKIFKERVRYFFRKGCTNPQDKCGTTKQDPMFGLVTTTCCDHRDFCNNKI